MKTFGEFLNEGFVNLLPSDRSKKEKYKDEVFALLQHSYKLIGGLKGKGFGSADEMKTIPMWKLSFIGGKLAAVVMYKDNNGRKLVAIGTDGTQTGKKKLKEILKVEFTRSYSEISGPLLGFMEKELPDILSKYKIPSKEVESIIGKKVKIIDDYFYTRKIGGDEIKKILLGTIEKHIT